MFYKCILKLKVSAKIKPEFSGFKNVEMQEIQMQDQFIQIKYYPKSIAFIAVHKGKTSHHLKSWF